jgi:hypothetical protein
MKYIVSYNQTDKVEKVNLCFYSYSIALKMFLFIGTQINKYSEVEFKMLED